MGTSYNQLARDIRLITQMSERVRGILKELLLIEMSNGRVGR